MYELSVEFGTVALFHSSLTMISNLGVPKQSHKSLLML